MSKTISSQRYLNREIVDEKKASCDYVVTVVTIDSIGARVIVDGHHSFAAAIETGVDPEYIECTCEDTLSGVEDVEVWLTDHWIDSDYYDVETGELFF